MSKGQIKAGLGYLVSNAGEYLVVGELLRRGVMAALTPRGAKDFDVIAEVGGRTVPIRVKSRTSDADSWVWNVKKSGRIFGDVRDHDIVVVVDLKDQSRKPDYYVVPTQELERKLTQAFEKWLHAPGRSRSPTNPQRRLGAQPGEYFWLRKYREAWHLVLDSDVKLVASGTPSSRVLR